MELMFDLETLDTKPSAAVLSLGAVLFDRTGAIHDRFYRALDLQAQFDAGRTVSQDTLLWWMAESAEARAEAFHPVRRMIPNALGEFLGWVKKQPGLTKHWCNGPAFDGVILESLARDFGCMVPWEYNQLRDQRTLVDAAGISIRDLHPDITGVPHTPIYDCEFQVAVITACRNKMKAPL